MGWAGWDSRHSLLKGPQALCVPAALNHLEVTPKVLFAAYQALTACFHSCPEGMGCFFFPRKQFLGPPGYSQLSVPMCAKFPPTLVPIDP